MLAQLLPDSVSRFLLAHMGLIYSVVTLLVIFLVYRVLTRTLRKHFLSKHEKPEAVQNFLFVWRYIWFGIAGILAVVSFSGSLASIGISAAFIGMIMGWSLQAPVTGIAAWLMIIVKRPFKIGDRIIIAGIIGDVVDINLTHVVLNQVGGTIGGEEKSGRGVLIPNAILFGQIIYNYTGETKYLLDEVPVIVTFESDLEEAKKIMLQAAREVTADIIAETGTEPFTRVEFGDWGMRIRVRYNTRATDRQKNSSDVSERIYAGLRRSQKVEFCYPHSEIIYSSKAALPGALPPGAGDPPKAQPKAP